MSDSAKPDTRVEATAGAASARPNMQRDTVARVPGATCDEGDRGMGDVSRRTALGLGAATVAAATAPVAARVTPGFLWGVATAAHQIEGNNINSDYWVLEFLPGTYMKEHSGDACDSLHRWREDLDLIRAAGLNSYRFSVEWARIEPVPGEFSTAYLDHYRRIAATARDMGIEPVVTFHHFTSPRWIAAMGGWENLATADRYARYCERTARALGDTIAWACTLNEPNAQVTSKVMEKPWAGEAAFRAAGARYLDSDRFHTFFIGDSFRVRDVCLAAHAKGREAIKGVAPRVKVGMTLALQEMVAGPGGEARLARIYAEARTPFYDAARGDDFIGVQTYNRFEVGADGYLPAPAGVMHDMSGDAVAPTALGVTIREAHRATGAPVFVTENGIDTSDDAVRVAYLPQALAAMRAAMTAGVPVLGYQHWSLLDNFEWSSGYRPRFGLVAVDRTTFKRTPKPSLWTYRDLVRAA